MGLRRVGKRRGGRETVRRRSDMVLAIIGGIAGLLLLLLVAPWVYDAVR